MDLSFSESSLAEFDAAPEAELDLLPFGVIGLDRDGMVEVYNAAESKFGGLSRDKVIGRHFFEVIAPCMNNFLVAQRFEDEPTLDDTINYVLTFRMRPQSVRLRMLQQPDHARRYIAILRRA